MTKILKNCIIILSCFFFHEVFSQGYQYECRKDSGHIIHILTIDSQKYTPSIIKARTQLFGRETVEAIAQRTGSEIVINGGFFEIGHNQDGLPSGTIMIDGQILGVKFVEQTCLIQDESGLLIRQFTPSMKLQTGESSINIEKMNKVAQKNDVVLYSNHWGKKTFTSYAGRKEIAIDQSGKLLSVSEHGNTDIPENGFVLSLPNSLSVTIDSSTTLVFDPLLSKKNASMIMGIPMLVENGTVKPTVLEGKSSFFTSPLARSAIGLRQNGEIVLVVVEHAYTKPLKDVTFGEAKSIISNNKIKLALQYKKSPMNLTLSELKEVIETELSNKKSAIGLTLPELAQLMADLGCQSAMNLDGGGSASLFVTDKIVNQAVGDQDEAMGQNVARAVSDAIIFKLK